MKKKDAHGIQESYSDIIMTGCSIPAGRKYLTVTAGVYRISIVWIRLLPRKWKAAVTYMEPVYSDKVREIYDISDKYLVIVTPERISAFDHILPVLIKGKVIAVWHRFVRNKNCVAISL